MNNVYINNVQKYMPNEPVFNDDIEHKKHFIQMQDLLQMQLEN